MYTCSFPVADTAVLKQKMLSWAKQFSIFCFLDNHHYSIVPQYYECLLGVGVSAILSSESGATLSHLNVFAQSRWCFGHLSYELSTSLHPVASSKKNKIGFPHFFFFQPQILFSIKGTELRIAAPDPDAIYKELIAQTGEKAAASSQVVIQQTLTKETYLKKVRDLQQHILRGDCYELNFCQEFYAEDALIDPVSVFQKLTTLSPTPFSALYKLHDKFLMCASPERFMTKNGVYLFSQPMKGTAKRDVQNAEKDEQLKMDLATSSKERGENVMVVDMVRNDLSRLCKKASVTVNELCRIHTFPQVHQMVSTISGELKGDVSLSDIITALFPMGSMTGAPKYRVMQLIEEYEQGSRGIFSGSVGYINPDGDFDFNVVIRSIMYNKTTKYVSYQAGSGITFYSDAEKEWEECLLKGEAMKKALSY